jgi:type IV pilus assembly protein PilV
MKTVLRKSTGSPSARRSAGFTIIEVAIAMLVLSVGLLGVAGLQATGMRSTYQSHQRSMAMAQARDLADRMRANLAGMRAAEYVKTIPAAPPSPDCESSGNACNAAQLAKSDLYNWDSMNGQLLPSGQGSVTCTDIDPGTPGVLESGTACLVTLRWDGDRTAATGTGCNGSSSDLTCLRLRFIP